MGLEEGLSIGLQMRRMQQQRMLDEAEQALQEKKQQESRQDELAKLSSNIADTASRRLATGEPREAVEAWAKSMHKAYGTGLTPKLANLDDNLGGGYEFHGFMPGQEEPWKANPRRQFDEQVNAQKRHAEFLRAETLRREGRGELPGQGGQDTSLGFPLEARQREALLTARSGLNSPAFGPPDFPGGVAPSVLRGMAPTEAMYPEQQDRGVLAVEALARAGLPTKEALDAQEKYLLGEQALMRPRISAESREEIARTTARSREKVAAARGRGGQSTKKDREIADSMRAEDKFISDNTTTVDKVVKSVDPLTKQPIETVVKTTVLKPGANQAELEASLARKRVYLNQLSPSGRAAYGGAPAPAGKKSDDTVVVTDGKERKRIPASRLKDAEAKGWKKE
jgi:hypothetical protein